jgi:sn-glycerol 3-phosphate transport system ATP-binding protein
MNLLTGRAEGSQFTLDGVALPLPAPAPRSGELIIGLRPEHVSLGTGPGWPLKVELIEMLGAERLVHGRIGEHGFTLRLDGTLPAPAAGSTLALQLSRDHLHWFDATTGARVE